MKKITTRVGKDGIRRTLDEIAEAYFKTYDFLKIQKHLSFLFSPMVLQSIQANGKIKKFVEDLCDESYFKNLIKKPLPNQDLLNTIKATNDIKIAPKHIFKNIKQKFYCSDESVNKIRKKYKKNSAYTKQLASIKNNYQLIKNIINSKNSPHNLFNDKELREYSLTNIDDEWNKIIKNSLKFLNDEPKKAAQEYFKKYLNIDTNKNNIDINSSIPIPANALPPISIKTILKKYFDYGTIINPKRRKKLSDWLNIKACPYCNSQYILSVEDGELFQLDHFYPQSNYPALALSFYNLIIACSYCNLKKDNKVAYIYPYEDDYDAICKFSLDAKTTIEHYCKTILNPSPIKINIDCRANVSDDDKKKAKEHNSFFCLESLYQNHSDYAQELLWKSVIYTPTYKNELRNLFANSELSITDNDINRFILGNYPSDEDFHKRPLSKLTRDIAQELGLL